VRRVVLLGSDLVVSTVGENLRGLAGFQISQVDPLLPDALERLEGVRPDVVLFDLAGIPPDFTITLLRKHPGLLMIGIDLKTNKVLVMSGKESHLLTLEDLVRAISEGTP
jgi:hypothetical protein